MADAYTGQDTIILEDYQGEWVLTDFADGAVAELTAPNEVSTIVTGYNGNALGAHNEPGRQIELALRLVKASDDDKRLNKSYNLWKDRDLRFKPIKGTFIKNVAHGDGSVTQDSMQCIFGLPTGKPVTSTDTTGNTDQVVSVYMIRFADSKRSL